MKSYDAIVIGAGNAGLAAATKLQLNGVKTLILERHNIPGGCATSFRRGGYEFEVALHQLSGIGSENKPGAVRRLFRELNIDDKIELVEEKELYRILMPSTLDITLPFGRKELVRKLQKEFPKESCSITSFIDILSKVAMEYHMAIPALQDIGDDTLVEESCPYFCQYGLRTTDDVLNEFFHDQNLKNVISPYWSYIGIPTSSLVFAEFAIVLMGYVVSKPWHIKGGSQSVSSALLESFSEAGGEYSLNCGVSDILTRDGHVTGVVTEREETISCEHVVSNASPVVTFNQLLKQPLPVEITEDFKSRRMGVSAFCIYLGLDCRPETIGITTASTFVHTKDNRNVSEDSLYSLDPPDWCMLTCYNFVDPDLAPQNKTVLVIAALQYGDPWVKMPQSEYYQSKYLFAEHLLSLSHKAFPDISNYIEIAEVATPLTMMRYLNTPGGSIYGFKQNVQDTKLFRKIISSIGGLHSVGSWTTMGGFQPAYLSGAHTADTIIKTISKYGRVREHA